MSVTHVGNLNDGVLPLNAAYVQDGSPLRLHGYLATAGSYFYETADVENVSDREVSAVTFGVIVGDREDRQMRLLVRSDPVAVSLPSGQIQTVAVHLVRASNVEMFLQMFQKPQAMLGVLGVAWADGTEWKADLPPDADDFANSGKRAEVAAWQIQAETPPGPPDALCYGDDGSSYSPGATVSVSGHKNRRGSCVNGGWMDS